VLARRITSYLLENRYIDTNSTMIQIQKAKQEKTHLHVVWLDLANAYGSVPHQLITYAMEFFYMPSCIKNMVASYFNDLQMCFALQDFTTGWQQLEIGIAGLCHLVRVSL